MLGTVLGVLLSVVTITDKGLVFQPALSPDGSQVAYAQDDGTQGVSIQVAPTAGGPSVKIATVGYGAEGVHLAVTALAHGPWSPDGKRLLFLAEKLIAPIMPGDVTGTAMPHLTPATATAEFVGLFTATPDGADCKPAGPSQGIVDAASFLPDGRVLFAWRDGRGSPRDGLRTVDPLNGGEMPAFDFADGVMAIDVALSADGTWAGVMTLTGPREEKVRGLCAIELATKKLVPIASPASANFLSWAGQTLLFSSGQKLMMWKPGDEKPSLGADQFWYAIGTPGGTLAFGLASDDLTDGLCAIDLGKHEDKELSDGFVPTSAAAGKIAVVRRTSAGAAIAVVDVTPEMIQKGDIGLPKAEPPAPPKPEEKK